MTRNEKTARSTRQAVSDSLRENREAYERLAKR